jgi:hypothetical protein
MAPSSSEFVLPGNLTKPFNRTNGFDGRSHKTGEGFLFPMIHQLKHENWILFPRSANPVLYVEIISCCHQAGFSQLFLKRNQCSIGWMARLFKIP